MYDTRARDKSWRTSTSTVTSLRSSKLCMKNQAAQFSKITSTEISFTPQLEFAKDASSLQLCSTSIWRTSYRRPSTNLHTPISIGGRPLCTLRFADDIDLRADSYAELQDLTTRLERTAGTYRMEVSSEKSKGMVNSRTQQPPSRWMGRNLNKRTAASTLVPPQQRMAAQQRRWRQN